jgi:hypothetical protein
VLHVPPGLDPFDLIAYYAFKLALLIIFLYSLYLLLKNTLK